MGSVDAAGGPAAAPDDSLHELRNLVERAGERPVAERLAVFDDVNARLAAELATLDEL